MCSTVDPLTPARRRRGGVVSYELGKRDIVALLGAARRGRQARPIAAGRSPDRATATGTDAAARYHKTAARHRTAADEKQAARRTAAALHSSASRPNHPPICGDATSPRSYHVPHQLINAGHPLSYHQPSYKPGACAEHRGNHPRPRLMDTSRVDGVKGIAVSRLGPNGLKIGKETTHFIVRWPRVV